MLRLHSSVVKIRPSSAQVLGPYAFCALFAAFFALFGVATAGTEAPYELELPIACVPGADCWVVRYVDHDPGPGERDYRCGRQTGEGHNGTDFALPHQGAMAAGVEVLAAAPGVVAGLRDGVPDVSVIEGGQEAIAGAATGRGSTMARAGRPSIATSAAAACG